MPRGTWETAAEYWRVVAVLFLVGSLLLSSGCAGSWSVLFLQGRAELYNLTVRYRFEDGSTAVPSHEALLREGEAYSVVSPGIDGFTASLPVVAGTMPAMDVIRNVTYTSAAVTEHTLTVTSAWGGSVTVPGEGTYTYTHGTVVDLVAAAEEAHRFTFWTGDTAAVDNANAATTTVAMTGDLTVTANFEEAIFFPDPNLDQVVRDEIGIPTGYLYRSDVLGLTELTAHHRGIISLEGLQHCVDLLEVVLNNNLISDLSPLAGLPQLRELSVGGNQISDVVPIAGLVHLTWLFLADNQIASIQPLAGLANLEALAMAQNQIVDIAPIAGLANLRALSLWDNAIVDVDPIAGLTDLVLLDLGSNPILDIRPVAGLVNLVVFHMAMTPTSDISPVAGLINLMELDLGGNLISDVSPLAGLTNLTRLGLWANQIDDLASLANLINLTDLDLRSNLIADIGPLAGLTSIVDLDLRWNFLNLTPGSSAMLIIEDFLNRGADVLYEPQN